VPWARSRGLDLTGEQLLAEHGAVETTAQQEHPGDRYPDILARSMRAIGERLGAEVTDEDAARLGGSVPDWPAFADSPAARAAPVTPDWEFPSMAAFAQAAQAAAAADAAADR